MKITPEQVDLVKSDFSRCRHERADRETIWQRSIDAVEVFLPSKARDWHHEVAPSIVDQALDIALAGAAITMPEKL